MRDFFVGLWAIFLFVVVSLCLGFIISMFVDLSPEDDNLLVKVTFGAFGLIGGFVFFMLCLSVGAMFSKRSDG